MQGKVVGGIMSFKWYYLTVKIIAHIDALFSRKVKCFLRYCEQAASAQLLINIAN